jgi:hypothetical protein
LDIIVIEIYSTGGFPFEKACEHCFQIQSVNSVIILISFRCYCGECSGYIVVILPLLAFYFCSAYILYLVYYILVIFLKNVLIIKIRGMTKITQIARKYTKEKEPQRNISRKAYAPKKIYAHQMKMKSVTVRQKYLYSWK